jgi:PAS domain S-box-containing protein
LPADEHLTRLADMPNRGILLGCVAVAAIAGWVDHTEKVKLTLERALCAAPSSVALTAAVAAALVLLLVVVNRRAAINLRRSEQWLSSTLNSIGHGVIATDASGRIRFLNPVAAALTGWSQIEALRQPLDTVFKIIAEPDGVAAESPVSHILREGGLVGLTNHTLLVRRDGAKCPIEDSGAPIKDQDGTLSGVVLVFKDASQARAAQVSLQSNEERLRLALDAAELGAWDRNLLSGREVWNTQLYRIAGYDPGTGLPEADAFGRIVPADAEVVKHVLERARKDRNPFRIEHRIVRRTDNVVRWIVAHGQYLYDDHGKAIRFLGVLRDVTEQRSLEQYVRNTQKLDALSTLAGGIAHDFNNILAILRGNLSLVVADLPADHNVRPAVVEMDRACSRAVALVGQILTFGRHHEQDRRVIQLETAVMESVQLLRATLPAQIEIRTHVASNLPAVLADRNQIQQIVTNLGVNAAHAIGRSAGVIEAGVEAMIVDRVAAERVPGLSPGVYVRLHFGDNGSGMPRDVLGRIFEPFFTTKPPGAGTGLGLSVVQVIVKNHEGVIKVDSEPGKGTRFEVYFPATLVRAVPVPTSLSELPKGGGERILFLDDEEALVALATRLLGRMGYRVAGFSNSARAIDEFFAAPHDFDLVLTDLSMPDMSGIDVARRILSIRPDIPVIVTTGYVLPDDVERARDVGVRQVVWKPNSVAELGALVIRLLNENRVASHS